MGAEPGTRLLVGSVYGRDDRNPLWYELQMRFLSNTVGAFDHVVFLNRMEDQKGLFSASRIVGTANAQGGGWEHIHGLHALIEYFAEHPEYSDYLILDSDAFPFRMDWWPRLLAHMDRADLGERAYAAPVRTENLDLFPHPSVVFVRGKYLPLLRDQLDFRPGPGTSLAGLPREDVGSRLPAERNGKPLMLPLIRTNAWNPHPIFGAVYGDAFYHHGAGSRPASSTGLGFYGELDGEAISARLLDWLRTDPDEYLRALSERQYWPEQVERIEAGESQVSAGPARQHSRTGPRLQVFWSQRHAFSPEQSVTVPVQPGMQTYRLNVTVDPAEALRIDPSDQPGLITIEFISLRHPGGEVMAAWDTPQRLQQWSLAPSAVPLSGPPFGLLALSNDPRMVIACAGLCAKVEHWSLEIRMEYTAADDQLEPVARQLAGAIRAARLAGPVELGDGGQDV
jgi:hypothetical protein